MRDLKLYHLIYERPSEAPSGDDEDAFRRFLRESLTDYLGAPGAGMAEALLMDGLPPIRKGPHGKPYFCGPELEKVFFSLSHTAGHAVLCFSDGEIGVDCENIDARPRIGSKLGGIAKRCFTEDEQAYVDGGGAGRGAEGGRGRSPEENPADGADRIRRFFEIWTAKEAYMKYTGNGFSEGFKSFSALSVPGVRIETGCVEGAPHVIYSVCTQACYGAGECVAKGGC